LEDEDYRIEIHIEAGCETLDAERLREALATTLRDHRAPTCGLSLAVVNDAHIGRLNREYLGHEGPTDCLSFDLRDPGSDHAIEGEIVVSWETARREADARGHSAQAELTLYAIHGLLHLLGYDDHEAEDAALMHEAEDRILISLGLGPVYGVPPK
jgi:probable rRNA maturation factor